MEFVIMNRRFKLVDDNVIICRAHYCGVETKNETWRPIKFCENDNGYLVAGITINGKSRKFLKHRILYLARNPGWDILDNSSSNCIDHINHSRTDNDADNLRVVTHQQNNFNRSNVKGYYWSKSRKKWIAQIMLNQVNKNLGGFDKEEDALAAYLDAKKKYHKFNTELTSHDLEEINEYNSSF